VSAEYLTQQFVNALGLGAIYALLALGLAIVFNVLGLLNFAYGELITVTGYTMFFLAPVMGLWPSAVVGMGSAIILSLIIQLVAFRPLRGAPAHVVIFASFAVSILIQALIRNVISPRPKGIAVPSWLDNVWVVGSFHFPVLSIITFVVAMVAMIGLTAFLGRTKQGLAIRAAAEDFSITRLMGVSADRMVVLAFALSGLLAGIAGILWIARTGSVAPSMGFNPLLQSFIAVVLGGFGSLRAAIAGGFALAFIEVSLQSFLPNDLVPFTAALTLVVVVAVLYFRPQGFSKLTPERVA